MNNKYKVIIFGKRIYREIELSDDTPTPVKVGTTRGCHVRFNKEIFFEEFEFALTVIPGGWQINCGKDVYVTSDGVMKLFSKELAHGDDLVLKYQNSNQEIFKISFMMNFDVEEKDYQRILDISGRDSIQIGGTENCDIQISDDLILRDSFTLFKRNGQYYITDNNTKYGVYINGIKVRETMPVLDYDFFSMIGYSFYLKYGKLYTSSKSTLHIRSLDYQDITQQQSHLPYPKFNRSTRVKYELPANEIEILPPPPKEQKPKKNMMMSLIPVIATLGLTVVMRGTMGGGSSFLIYSAATMAIGAVMSVVSALSDSRQYKKDCIKREETYQTYIAEKEEEIKSIRENEHRILEMKHPSLANSLQEVDKFGKRLFEKDRNDDDFLSVRLGTGQTEAQCKVKFTKQEFADTQDKLISLPEQMEYKFRYLNSAPILSDFNGSSAVGILGSDTQLYDMLKNITLDISVHHFYNDVKLFYMFDEKNASRFAWIRWLRHVNNDRPDLRNFMCDDESRSTLLEHLYSVLSQREMADQNTKFDTYYVVFVFDSKGIAKHPISKYIEKCKDYGFTFVFFEKYEELLPKGCTEILRLNSNDSIGALSLSQNGDQMFSFAYEKISDAAAERAALKLSSVYVDEVSLESEMTKNISLFQLLHILSIDDLDIQSRWEHSVVFKSMAAPLGVKNKAEVVYLDLNEKRHGPHGLVAGTTGSGKSEILQTYILSMATLFHPYEVSFVIIDFKGGGMVNQFHHLPHLIGSITNIDGREIQRSLLSIKAELHKRQEVFALAGVNHIDAYIKKYKARECTTPIPHLILIVDEFAELKSEQPDFMKELISAARIGRSLGVHLILATQKPSGVVDDQIWSNSKFKLCLKVQTKEDSNEVLKSPLAAEIKEPGRAYLQVGNNEVFELFQSAYSGAPAENDEMENKKEFAICEVSLSGKRTPVFVQKKGKASKKSDTQLEAIVDCLNQFCLDNQIEKLPGICLPSLPTVIRYSDAIISENQGTDVRISIGLYDDPSHQLQDQVFVNLTQEHMMIIGSSQYGKTNLLQTLVRGLAESYTPKQVHLYILDFASMILKNFEELKHVGGVITVKEDEKLKNFMKMMNAEIAARKDILSKLGISSFASYKEAGYTELPQIVILLDNFTAFKELYEDYEDDMLNICREGVSVGISLVIANQQTNGIGYRYLSNFSRRIALYCNDSGEYGSLFDRCRMQPLNTPGRALVEIDKNIYEYQTYLGFDGEKEIERVSDMKRFVSEMNQRYPENKAKQIPEIPNILTSVYTQVQFAPLMKKEYSVLAGLDYSTVTPVLFNLKTLGVLALAGREKSGKGNFVRHIVKSLQNQASSAPTEVTIIDDVTKKFQALNSFGIVKRYTLDAEAIRPVLCEWEAELKKRYESLLDGGDSTLADAPLFLLIVQNEDVLTAISNDYDLMEKYKLILSKYKAMKFCILYANIKNETISYSAPDALKMLKESPNMMVFEDLSNFKVFELPFATTKEFKKPIELGDAYYIKGNETRKMKTVLSAEEG